MKKDNKTIGVTLRFYTNGLEVKREGKEILACWEVGNAVIEANKEKGIKAHSIPINCFDDIIPALKELFRKSHIIVASPNRKPRVLSHLRKTRKKA